MEKYLILFAFFLVFQLAPAVLAEYDPPGPPAVEVRVWLISFTPLDDFDDGWNGKSDIKFEASADPKKNGEGGSVYLEYDHDTVKGKIVPGENGKDVMHLIYRERECWPIDLEVEIKATDVDSPPYDPDDVLGKATLKVHKSMSKSFYNVVIPGKFVVRLYVEAVPVKEDSDKCSYFFDQSETMSSSHSDKERCEHL